ncbi:hypothetical protein F4009_15860 [Candidatus Poribacteria bacterium]|nr:hypothetical protein [Candidatus Poribacteria bacterium]MYH81783.1 hypothetical protein [Candidatus Poribacteria bacterium]MYK95449.1 hypothetical protein [Candidatus Poribacteria bacterium]
MFVPVKTRDGQQLMPMHAARARKLIKRGEATPYWNNGIYCIRLNKEPSDREIQKIAVGVDPGSKKEGFTVKSEAHTYLNVQADAHGGVGKKVEKRRELRRGRRSRKCPNRKNRTNRLANRKRIPAGTRARWDWKLRILDWLSKLYPITHVCVEDIKAETKQYQKQWNQSFSPLEVGKQWFYTEVRKRWELFTVEGWQTKEIRDRLGLKKSSKKLSETFEAHCVDSWCLAYHTVGGQSIPDNTAIFCIAPIPIRRRELHRQNPQKGGKRPRYGGTMCLGISKNTLVKHVKHGLLRVTGFDKEGLNLSELGSAKRVVRNAKQGTYRVLRKLNFRYKDGNSPLC